MLYSFIQFLVGTSSAITKRKRRFTRHPGESCVIELTGRTFPVENWSQGGALVFADEKRFSLGEKVDVNLKFKLQSGILNVTHSARIIRKSSNGIALEFGPLTRKVRNALHIIAEEISGGGFSPSYS